MSRMYVSYPVLKKLAYLSIRRSACAGSFSAAPIVSAARTAVVVATSTPPENIGSPKQPASPTMTQPGPVTVSEW